MQADTACVLQCQQMIQSQRLQCTQTPQHQPCVCLKTHAVDALTESRPMQFVPPLVTERVLESAGDHYLCVHPGRSGLLCSAQQGPHHNRPGARVGQDLARCNPFAVSKPATRGTSREVCTPLYKYAHRCAAQAHCSNPHAPEAG